MKYIKIILIVLSLSACLNASGIPPILEQGFSEYHEHGPEAALEAWLKGSPHEKNVTYKRGVLEAMVQVQELYGEFESYEVVAAYSVSTRVERIYIVSYHAKGPMFGRFDAYETNEGDWILLPMRMHTDINDAFPCPITHRQQNKPEAGNGVEALGQSERP